ncbi:hypothetical protein O6P43_003647 [Quillaja saponaria]|uniref:Uncharacterized protein n=1 Tax=Quillaja saponaria TaxID=32244 RepID=A0AAD7VLT8_QUISA|nr:hypothetical protein O6P43_003647 [Quillaja saponaria]
MRFLHTIYQVRCLGSQICFYSSNMSGRMTDILDPAYWPGSSSGIDKSSCPRTHAEILRYNHGKGGASFKVEGRGFNNSNEVVNIKHDYGLENEQGHGIEQGSSIGMTIKKSRLGGLQVDVNISANFVMVPERQQRSVTGGGRFSVSEIQTERYSYGPSNQGLFIVERARGNNGCVRMLRIMHKYYNTESDGPLIIEHKKIGSKENNQLYTSRKCYSLCLVVKIGIARSGGIHVEVEFSDSPLPPTPVNPMAWILGNISKGGDQNIRGLINSSGTTVGNANGSIIFYRCNF